MFWVCYCRCFPSLEFPAQRSSFSICCTAGLVVLNSLSFCLSVKFLMSPLNLSENLDGQSNLGCRFFPFITLNIFYHSLLACRVSAEKSADNLMGIHLYVIFCFSLAAFNIFTLNLIFVFFFNDTATTEIYTLSLHDALPICKYLKLKWFCRAKETINIMKGSLWNGRKYLQMNQRTKD